MKLVSLSDIEWLKAGDEFRVIFQDNMFFYVERLADSARGFIGTNNVDKMGIVPEEDTALIILDEAC